MPRRQAYGVQAFPRPGIHGDIIPFDAQIAKDLACGFFVQVNFDPAEEDAQPVAWIAEKVTTFWGDGAQWVLDPDLGVHEAGYLKLDASRARAELNWQPHLSLETALHWLVDWYRAWQKGEDMHAFTLAQIAAYQELLLQP